MRYRGVAYYPEAWPNERWDDDIALMQAAGINLVRMGEFAWSRFEPEDGRFALAWWVDVCERMHKAGIHVLACTPSAAPPAWLTRAHPDTLHVGEDGKRATHGMRRHYCPTSPVFREFVQRVNHEIATAVRDNPSIVAWQIDNEIAPEGGTGCCCDACTKAFRAWLKERHGDLQALNQAWGNLFWSGDFSTWDEIGPPYPQHARKSWRLDLIRFVSHTFAEFCAEQAATLRAVKPDWLITSNCWVGLNPAMDVREVYDHLDVAANDAYLDYYACREVYGAVWDWFRNIKSPPKPFWVTETGAWHSTNTEAGTLTLLRPYAYLALAKGVDAYVYFRWRQSVMGEEDHPAVLDWSGDPGRAYKQVSHILNELKSLGEAIEDLPLPHADVAILSHFDSAHTSMLLGRDSMMRVTEADATLNRLHLNADVVPVRGRTDLTRYKLVILPQLEMVDADLAAALRTYVKGGGMLLVQPRLSTVDANGKYQTVAMPAGLTDLVGVRVRERCDIASGRVRTDTFHPNADPTEPRVEVTLCLDGSTHAVHGREHMELIEPDPAASVLAHYTSGSFTGSPALVERGVGDGGVLHQACWLDEAGTRAVVLHALARAGVELGPETPKSVNILKRGALRFYLNFGLEPVDVPRLGEGVALVGDADRQTVRLPAAGVCVIQEAPKSAQ